tara:strand:- start:2388 stop:2978 length:591 start_codon:yes stop_codon:yes gene_type:complete
MIQCGDNSEAGKGIDLETYANDVRQIFYAHFGATAAGLGYDPEDVLAEIYLGIVARNNRSSAWDPSRGRSRAGYIWLVCSSVFRNYHRKHSRWEGQHQVGVHSHRRDEGLIDVADSDLGAGSTVEDRLYLCERMNELADAVGADGLRYLRAATSDNKRAARMAAGLSISAARSVDEQLRAWAGVQSPYTDSEAVSA